MLETVSQVVYMLTVIPAALLAVRAFPNHKLLSLVAIVYIVFATLYTFDVAYHASIGYFGWAFINTGLFCAVLKRVK